MSESGEISPKLCPQCSGIAGTDARFCKHCAFDLTGSALTANAPSAPARSQHPAAKHLGPIIGIAILVLLALGAVVAYRYYQNQVQLAAPVSTPAPTPTLSLGEKAKRVEEKILRGEALQESDTTGLSATELRVLRNVHFARYGRKYDSPGLGDYFNTCAWYTPSDEFKDSMVTATDKANINLIVEAESQAKQSGSEGAVTANANTTAVPAATLATPPSPANSYVKCSGTLTTPCAQRVLEKWAGSGAVSGLIGVQEIPAQNAAQANFHLTNYHYIGGMDNRTPLTYSGQAAAVFSRFTDGRWMLTRVYLSETIYGVYINTNTPVD
ncbi:MAG: YARHG domain-containing protein [Pyrinomonadaceae bacterium]